jgi:hypothetical protein
MIVPYHFTLWEAASSPRTQAFLLVGTLFLLPVILMIHPILYRHRHQRTPRGRTGFSVARCARILDITSSPTGDSGDGEKCSALRPWRPTLSRRLCQR